jgi:hypothetical protein
MHADESAICEIGLRIVTPKAMQTKQSDEEFNGCAGRKRPQAVDREVVELPELVYDQGSNQ